MGSVFCFLSPISCASTSIAKATLGDLFSALTNWVLSSVSWLLAAAGQVLTTASEPATVVRSATAEFNVLLVVSPLLMVVGLMVATIQALRHGDASSLWRLYLGVAPACVLGVAIARPVAGLVLTAVNQLSTSASTAVISHESTLANALTSMSASTPGFGLFLLAIGVVIGCWLLWCELIVRSVVLTLLLVLVPVVVPLTTFPALRRAGWRLAETFLAVAASKFIIVITLSLGLDELQGSSATQVITGAVTIVLATCTPFVLLRVVPLIEQSALHGLEGLRQRYTRATQSAVTSAAGAARAVVPAAPMPEPPERSDDLGLGVWEGDGEMPLPSTDTTAPPPPLGEPTLRGGHVAYRKDDLGPVIGWHFDE